MAAIRFNWLRSRRECVSWAAADPNVASAVQGVGGRDDATEFQLDGLNANAGMDERGMAIPNVDTIAEFSVETNSFSAEQGRNPLQVLMLTKSGTNAFHGTLWEFLRNEKLDAFNTFAKTPGARKPKLSRNQFGATLGGPIIRNKTFFFASFEGTTIRQARIYNSNTVLPEMLQRRFFFRSHSDPRSAHRPTVPRKSDPGRIESLLPPRSSSRICCCRTAQAGFSAPPLPFPKIRGKAPHASIT